MQMIAVAPMARSVGRIVRGDLFRNTAALMSGTATAQFVALAVQPALSRLYTPADFGALGVYMSVVAVAGSVSTLRFDQAVVLPKRDAEAANLLALAVLAGTCVAALAAGPFLLMRNQIAEALGAPMLARWLWLVPVSVALSSLYVSLNGWCTRTKWFRRAAVSQMARAVTAGGVQCAGGLQSVGPAGLVGGALIGDAVAALTLGLPVARRDASLLRQSIGVRRMRALVREYQDFPLYSSTQSLLNAVSQGVPMMLLARYFGVAVAGYYAVGVRLVQWPMNLVLTSLRQVLLQRTSEVYNAGGDTYALFRRTTVGLLLLVSVPAVAAAVFAPTIFRIVLGEQWATAGHYAQWLVLWLAVGFCNLPAVLFAQVCRRQRALMLQDAALLVCRCGALAWGASRGNAMAAIVAYSGVGVAFNMAVIVWMWRVLRPRPGAPTATER